MGKRVVVAMSGGVDSSVAAALLREQGYEVVGITLNVWPKLTPEEAVERHDACCSLSAVEDARRVADMLGIPHYVLNFREVFQRTVIDDFAREYLAGRTPNPCIRCNEFVKFDALLRKALGLGAEYVATGHYVRVQYDQQRQRYTLRKAADQTKDQTYVLYVLKQEQLRHTLFPLGDLTKENVRKMAHERGLPVAAKAESQEICFVTENDYGVFLTGYVPDAAKPGPILDTQGRQLGQHRGIIFYTIGQRRGLGISSPEAMYVVAIDVAANAVIVGPESELYHDELIANRLNLVSVDLIREPLSVRAKVRYKMTETDATVRQIDRDTIELRFAMAQRAITPGQAVVFYQDGWLVGGATIVSSRSTRQRHLPATRLAKDNETSIC
ncbi:MAG: tRNA 2-thiouridine(34) synthase MnmA [Chloroflexi bacterium]|nr:tRNA 2-thiouridine(34) synthase MnmA [Chloroflexota bacterium]